MCPRWVGNESDENDGTPPPDYMLHATEEGGVQRRGSLLIRTATSDTSTLSKGDSALDLAYLDEVVHSL